MVKRKEKTMSLALNNDFPCPVASIQFILLTGNYPGNTQNDHRHVCHGLNMNRNPSETDLSDNKKRC